jgi:hypothetical protein
MMSVPSTRRQGLAQRLYFLLPCWHHGRASSRSQPNCLGAHRHRALARPCTSRGHDHHPPCIAHHPNTDVRTKFPPLTCPSRRSLSLCLCVARAHAHPATLPPRRAVPFPTRVCRHPWCPIRPLIARVYKAPSIVRWSTGEPPSPPCSASIAAAAEIPSYRLSFLSRRSRGSAGPQSCSQTNSSHFFFVGEP